MKWKLTYKGPHPTFYDFETGLLWHKGESIEVEDDVKTRILDSSRLIKDEWDVMPNTAYRSE